MQPKHTRAIRNVGRHPGTYSWFLAADCLGQFGDKNSGRRIRKHNSMADTKAVSTCGLPLHILVQGLTGQRENEVRRLLGSLPR